MIVDGAECLILQRGRATVVEQNRVECRRVPGRGNTAKYGDVSRARIICQRDPWRQRNSVANGCMRLDPRRADSVIVERVVDQELVGVPLIDDSLHVVQVESYPSACCGRFDTFAHCRRTFLSRTVSCR